MSELLHKYRSLNAVGRIIAITVAIYLLTQCYQLLLALCCITGYAWQDYLALSANLNDVLLKPWTVVTYMFLHADLTQAPFHLLLNMACLYWLGQLVRPYYTDRRIWGLYLTGGLVAGLFVLLVYNLFPALALYRSTVSLIGASGAIFALVTAVGVQYPEAQVTLQLFTWRWNVRFKWIAIVAILPTLVGLLCGIFGGNVCHIGGALWGLFYALMARRGVDVTAWCSRLTDRIAALFKPRRRMTVTRGGARVWPGDRQQDRDYNRRQRANEAQIDAILDKMRRSGYDGLTEEEKKTLFSAGKK